MEEPTELYDKPITVEQLKILKKGNTKVNFTCLYPNCNYFNGVHTINEIDDHIKKEHHKGGLFRIISARCLSKIEKIG